MLEHRLIIDRFEGDKAILKFETGETIIYPKDKLKPEYTEGEILILSISTKQTIKKEKKELAKEILNEILSNE